MRIGWGIWLSLLAAAAAACAGPVVPPDFPKTTASPDPALRAEAENYALQMTDAVNKIESDYVRSVSRVDLVEAALIGLYDAAREPVPPGLRADVAQGVQQELRGLLFRVRERLGPCDALRQERAVLASLQAIPRVLDPHCGLAGRAGLRGQDIPDTWPNTGLEFVGVPLLAANIAVATGGGLHRLGEAPVANQVVPAGPLRVQSVTPGSPAQRAGVRTDDLVTRLNGQPPESSDFAVYFQQLRPTPPNPSHSPADIRLTLVRAGRPEPFDIIFKPAAYRPESVFGARRRADGTWDFMLDPAGGIGYARLGTIRNGSSVGDEDRYGSHEEFRDALRSMNAAGLRGLVLDLRWCPGGYLIEAASIARLLLPAQLPPDTAIAWQCGRETEKGARPRPEPVTFAVLDRPYTEFPVVILVNEETTGGGELIAAALQDLGRAAVAGQRTRGKGTVQNQPHVGGFLFKLSTGMLLRPGKAPVGEDKRVPLALQRFPNSKPSDDWGVRPDEGRELPLTPEAGRRLKDLWTIQTLRPPGAAEALPLDDPENDPQRLAAVQMLAEMIKK
jgi:C-terminal processing protease CtpA/Prc